MTLVSYAQNFEDVILWRALRDVERGFYIDVGAQDPVIDSVSLSFYEQGWRGVHVEPTAHYAEKLRRARPDEDVVQSAVGTAKGTIVFWEFPDTGLSTGVPAVAEKHWMEGWQRREISIPCTPLSQILDACRSRDVHWLKIDVEGMERAVIESWLPSTVRPWLVVVESTKPVSQEASHAEWEPNLCALGYEFVYFDGLNRFYVSGHHPELKPKFGPGPNVFDDFVLAATTTYCRIVSAEAARVRQELVECKAELAVRQSNVEKSLFFVGLNRLLNRLVNHRAVKSDR